MNKIKIKYLNQKLCAAVLAGAITLTTSGCSKELSSSTTDYDTIDTNLDLESSNEITKGVTQVLPVTGEDFNLVIEYMCDDSAWCITSDKKLYMTIYTDGLPDNKKVYIDNIHMDTTIVSTNAYFDGIKQDTLDDRIHNSLMIGFPISDNNKFYGINVIEGQNSEFLEGYSHGYSGYHSSSVETQRYLESDFLEDGVWANKIAGAIGLLIEDTKTNEISGVDVSTDLLIEINNKVTFEKKDKYVTYQYDKYGNCNIVEETPKTKKNVKTK